MIREGTDASRPRSTQVLHTEFNLVPPEAKSKCESVVRVIYLRYCSRTHNKGRGTTEEEKGKQHLEKEPICIFFRLDSW